MVRRALAVLLSLLLFATTAQAGWLYAPSSTLTELENTWSQVQHFDAGLDVRYSSVLFDRLSVNSSGNLLFAATEKAPGAATAALAGLGAGNVNTGTHSYKITFVTAGGETDAGAVSGTVTTTAGDGQVALSAIPTGSPVVTARKVYRTAAGNAVTGPWLLLATISDNTTTTYADNTADASLTTAIPTANTAVDTRWTFKNSGVFDTANTAPSFSLTDTTASAKDLTIAVDGDLAQLRESAGAAGSLLVLDLANNRVGIGTTNPGSRLTVQVASDTGNSNWLSLQRVTNNLELFNFKFVDNSGAQDMSISSNNLTNILYLGRGGSSNNDFVGINTGPVTMIDNNPKGLLVGYTVTNSMPISVLDLTDTGAVGTGGGIDFLGINNPGNATPGARIRTLKEFVPDDRRYSMAFYTHGNTGNGVAGLVEAMRITSTGNVGIGTTGPTSFLLQVAGNIGPNANGASDLGNTTLGFKRLYLDYTNSGTIGAVTINKASFRANIALGATSVVVTNSYVTAASKVLCVAAQNDTTGYVKASVPAAGSVTIYSPVTTANMAVDCIVINAD